MAFWIVGRDEVTLGLCRAETAARDRWWSAYVCVEDVHALRAELLAEGLGVGEMREPEIYGMQDFDVTDPDGNRVGFGQSLDPVPGPGPGEGRGRE